MLNNYNQNRCVHKRNLKRNERNLKKLKLNEEDLKDIKDYLRLIYKMVSYSDIQEFEIKSPKLFISFIIITFVGLFFYVKYNL